MQPNLVQAMQEWATTRTAEQLREMFRRLNGPEHRTLEGKEYDRVWTLLQLLQPIKSSNNQRTMTDEYLLNNKRYDVTYGLGDRPIIDEYTKETK